MSLRGGSSARDLRWLGIIVAGGLAVRLVLLLFGNWGAAPRSSFLHETNPVELGPAELGRFAYDVDILSAWALTLADHGPSEFYAETGSDHLPGDMWLVWLVGLAFRILSPQGGVGDPVLDSLIKLVPILSDVAAAAFLFLIGRALAGERAGLVAAGLYAFNPAPIFASAVWGQWDSVSAALLLLAVWCLLLGRVVAALPALTLAALIKPQLAVVGGLAMLAFFLSSAHRPPRLMQVAVGALLSLVLLVFVTVPFDAPPWPTDHDLYDQAQTALDRHDDPTVGAFNFWALAGDQPPGAASGGTDLRGFALGADYRIWGVALSGLAILAAVVRLVPKPDDRRLLWACCVAALAVFVFSTRMHSRYLLPAVALAIVLAAVEKRYRGVAILLSVALFANLYWAYDFWWGLPSLPLLTDTAAITIFAIVNVGLLVGLLLFPPGRPDRSEGTAQPGRSPLRAG